MSIEVAIVVVAVGVCVGVVSALFGIGGGIVMVPFLVLVLGESQHVAVGTSLVVIVPTALAGVYAHRNSGYLNLRNFLAIGLSGVTGAFLGARGALLLDGPELKTLFAIFLAIVGFRLVVQARRVGAATIS